MNKKFSILAFVIGLAVLCACKTSPKAVYLPDGPHLILTSDAYTHQGSGFVFPTVVAGFMRSDLDRYDRDGLDVGAGYSGVRVNKPLQISVFVYPGLPIGSFGSPENVIEEARAHRCNQSLLQSESQLLAHHKNAVPLEKKKTLIVLNNKNVALVQSEYKLDGEKANTMITMYCPYRGDWILKFLSTYPESFDGRSEIKIFSDELLKENP
jgi:hypothetical protein